MPPPAATTAWGGDSLLALSAERTDDLVALEDPADFLVIRPVECGLDVGRAKAAIGSDRQPRPFHRGKAGSRVEILDIPDRVKTRAVAGMEVWVTMICRDPT